MSVYKSKREESSVQFLETAREIQIHTIRQLAKIPNKYKYYLSGEIAALAAKGHTLLKEANSIFPKSKAEAEMRILRFTEANAAYQALVSQIGVAEEFADFSDSSMTAWMDLISKELVMIKRLISSDKERYGKLS